MNTFVCDTKAFSDYEIFLVTMSIGGAAAYSDSFEIFIAEAIAARGGKPNVSPTQFETNALSVYLTAASGNSGDFGLQTTESPAISSGAIGVASADNEYTLRLYIVAPDGSKIYYNPGRSFAGWKSSVKSTIYINSSSEYAIMSFRYVFILLQT